MNSSTDVSNTEDQCDFDQNLNTLRGISFFSSLGMEPLKALAYICKRMHYQSGDVLFHQGETDNQAYCLISGELQVLREQGGEQALLHRLQPGSFIGALSLVAQTRRLFTVQAGGTATCMILPQKHFLAYLPKSPEVAIAFFHALYRSIMQWEEALLNSRDWRKLGDDNGYAGVTLI
jgi:CRP/FNR family transcriptional regulator, cyclic AMP receptor protein